MSDDPDGDGHTEKPPDAEPAATTHGNGLSFQTRRAATPVPGFPQPGARRVPETAGAGDTAQPDVRTAGAERVDPRAERRMLSVRVSAELYGRYERILRELRAQGVDSSMTEIVSALLYVGPLTAGDTRPILRALRRGRDAGL